MRKESRAMDSEWALEVMHKAPYVTVSFIDEYGRPYGLPLSLASHLLSHQPASASNMIKKAWN